MTPNTIDALHVAVGLVVYAAILLVSAPPIIRSVMSLVFKERDQ